MCGIVGMIHQNGENKVDVSLLQAMNRTLVHRGPDDEGYWAEGPVGIAMRRLSIIDLEGGHQPICNETGEIWTVFNGEIYNFVELRQSLIEKGHRFKTNSDTEVIVHLYEDEGSEFVSRLRGMFAIALWDARCEKLFLFRDRVGIKPLYYRFHGGDLQFGSEMKALMKHPAAKKEVSLKALNHYLSFLYIPSPESIYQDIRKLPAGHGLQYHQGEVKIFPYWDFKYEPDLSVSEAEWSQRLRAKLEESVRLHLRSDVPVGSFLSGGMDSSTIVALMTRHRQDKVRTYSMGFEDDQYNELPFAREIAEHFGTDHHEEMVKMDAIELLPRIMASFDEPFADSSSIPTYLVSKFARKDLKVILSGDGGDELFGGYLWTQKEKWLEGYRQVPSAIRNIMAASILGKDYRPLRETSGWSRVQRFLYDAGMEPVESFSRRIMCFQPWMKRDLFQPWVLESLKQDDSLGLVREYFEHPHAKELLDKLLYIDSKVYLPADLLVKVDRMSMVHSLEVRVPLLDHEVVELSGKIPFHLKQKGRATKYILKKAVEGLLPASITQQRKQGFSIPIHRWFREDLYEVAQKMLLEKKSLSRQYFRPEAMQGLLQEHRSGKQQYGAQLFALMAFEVWVRQNQSEEGLPLEASLKEYL